MGRTKLGLIAKALINVSWCLADYERQFLHFVIRSYSRALEVQKTHLLTRLQSIPRIFLVSPRIQQLCRARAHIGPSDLKPRVLAFSQI